MNETLTPQLEPKFSISQAVDWWAAELNEKGEAAFREVSLENRPELEALEEERECVMEEMEMTPLEAGKKYSTGEEGPLEGLLSSNERNAMEGGKKWRVEWKFDGELRVSGGRLPEELSARGMGSLRGLLLLRGPRSEVLKEIFPEDASDIVAKWSDRKGVLGAYAEDIPTLLALRKLLGREGVDPDELYGHFRRYYAEVSLLKRVKPDRRITRDPVNYRIALAIAIAVGGDRQQLLEETKPKDTSLEDYEAEVEKYLRIYMEGGLAALAGENGRIVGRLMLLEYIAQRRGEVGVRRALEEVILLSLAGILPTDTDRVQAIQNLGESERMRLIEEVKQTLRNHADAQA